MKKEQNPGKRKKTQANPTVERSRKMLQKLFVDEVDSGRFKAALAQLSPEDYTDVMMFMMPFFMAPNQQPLHENVTVTYFTGLSDISEN